MAEPQTRENLAQNPSLSPLSRSSFAADPDPGNHPLAPPAVASDSGDVCIEDPDLIRESKRRRHCPTALENLDELTSASNSSFAFSFDTNLCVFSAEITPKFGSFNSIAQEIETKKKKREPSEVRGDEEEDKLETVRQGEDKEEEEEEEEEIVVADALLEAIGGGEKEGDLESVAD